MIEVRCASQNTMNAYNTAEITLRSTKMAHTSSVVLLNRPRRHVWGLLAPLNLVRNIEKLGLVSGADAGVLLWLDRHCCGQVAWSRVWQ